MKVREYLENIENVELSEEKVKELNDVLGVVESEWIPKYGEDYWYIDYKGAIKRDTFYNHGVDNARIEFGNCYKTNTETIMVRDKQKATKRVIKETKRLNAGWKPNWKDDIEYKWYIQYNHDDGDFVVIGRCFTQIVYDNDIYIKSKELAFELLQSYKEDLKIMFNVED